MAYSDIFITRLHSRIIEIKFDILYRPDGLVIKKLCMSTAEKTRMRIRRSGQILVAGHGVGNLTLDAIAQYAGLSKGGLHL